ncbi:MAG: cell division protein SepF [Bacillota bacterium]
MKKLNSYWNNILDFFGFKEELSDSHYENEDHKSTHSGSKIISINKKNKKKPRNKFKLIIHNPESYNEVKAITDDLKNNVSIILNLEDIERNQARRFIDFVSGAVYGLNGKVQKVGSGVFLFTPSSVEIDGEILDDLKNNLITS